MAQQRGGGRARSLIIVVVVVVVVVIEFPWRRYAHSSRTQRNRHCRLRWRSYDDSENRYNSNRLHHHHNNNNSNNTTGTIDGHRGGRVAWLSLRTVRIRLTVRAGAFRCVVVVRRRWWRGGWRWQLPVPLLRARVFRKYAVLSRRRRLRISVYYYYYLFFFHTVVLSFHCHPVPAPPMPSFRHAIPAVHGARTVYRNTVYVNSVRRPRPGAPAAAVRRRRRRCRFYALCPTMTRNYMKKHRVSIFNQFPTAPFYF